MRNYLLMWIDSYSDADAQQGKTSTKVSASAADSKQTTKNIDWIRILPFILLHALVLGAFFTGFSATAFWVGVAMYVLRMFAITGFYHRYFAHKSFKTSRVVQFVFALIGTSSAQKGPLWWASHHRHHHRFSDTEDDVHGPQNGFFYSHMGWFLTREYLATKTQLVKDWTRFPELILLDRFALLVPVFSGIAFWCLGYGLESFAPSLQTNGWQMFIWGYVISTVCVLHATLFINSLAHKIGRRRYQTRDTSKNSFLLAIITFGEGWHNNHHYAPGSIRQGFHWWQIDMTFYGLWVMKKLGLIWDFRPVPAKAYLTDGSMYQQGSSSSSMDINSSDKEQI